MKTVSLATLLIVVVLLASACVAPAPPAAAPAQPTAAPAQPTAAPAAEPIKIGVIYNLTGGASLDVPSNNGAKLALKKLTRPVVCWVASSS